MADNGRNTQPPALRLIFFLLDENMKQGDQKSEAMEGGRRILSGDSDTSFFGIGSFESVF